MSCLPRLEFRNKYDPIIVRGEMERVWTSTDKTCQLWFGENLIGMDDLRRKATLIYMDPPFFTQRSHRLLGKDDVAFDDVWNDLDHYLRALKARIRLAWVRLADDGCLVVHVDTRVSHYVRVLGDEIFGPKAFASEVVWRYRRWPTKTANYQRVHDVLLRFRKNPSVPPKWVQLYEPASASTQATWGTGKQRAQVDGTGKRLRSQATDEPSPGVPLGDVWEIPIIAPVAKERTGYPTQKPMALLERLILSLTHPGDLIVDPYAGSGTTLVAAMKHGRSCIAMDSSREAIEATLRRLGMPAGEKAKSRVGLRP